MALTRGNTSRKRPSESPLSSPPPQKMRAISDDSDDEVAEEGANVEDYVDVEAEFDPDSPGHSVAAGAEDDAEADSSNEWVVADDVDLSEYDSSATLSDTDEFPPTLTGGRLTDVGAREATEEAVHLGTIDVKGKSVAVRIPVVDNTDALMSGDDEEANVPMDVGDLDVLNDDACGSGVMDTDDVVQGTSDVAGIVSQAGSVALGRSVEHGIAGVNKEKVVADLFAAVKDKRPVHVDAPPKDKPAKKVIAATGNQPEQKQTTLALKRKDGRFRLDEPFVREDDKPVQGKFLRRLVVFSGFANDNESMFYVRNEPRILEWSHGKVKVARLIVKGQATAMRLMVVGQITWNGMLPIGRGDDGPQFPTRAKIAIKCLRDADFLHLRGLIKHFSDSRTELELQNMSTISAFADCGERKRGSDSVVGVPFLNIYNAEKKYSANKYGMELMRPNQLVRNDIVMLEVSVGHYYDITGKQPNWSSTRVCFCLEAISLLLRHGAQTTEGFKPKASSSVPRTAPMDVSI